MDSDNQSPFEIIAHLEKRLAAMEAREALLVPENSLLRQLYERAPLGYQSLDENGCFLFVNQTWVDSLGYTKEEVIGRNFSDFLHPEWQEHFRENFPRFKAIGEILGVEFEMIKKGGTPSSYPFMARLAEISKAIFSRPIVFSGILPNFGGCRKNTNSFSIWFRIWFVSPPPTVT